MESRIIVFSGSAPCIGDSARTRPDVHPGARNSRRVDVPRRWRSHTTKARERSISGICRIDTRIAFDRDSSGWGPGVRFAGRYAMGLGERRHGYGECVADETRQSD